MRRLHVAILDASVGDTPAERNFRRELDAEVTAFKVSTKEWPDPPASDGSWTYDAAVITGSQTSVYWDESWMETLESLVESLHDAGIPILGVCWGHQFLAQTFGGSVEPMAEYELGYRPIERYDESPLFEGMPGEFVAFETHSDEVTALPPGATELAGNDRSCQAFSLGTTYGVQFHPEYDLETARHVTEGKRDEDVSEALIGAVLDDLTTARYEEARVATRVFDNFLAIVARETADVSAE
jgi:GMP synthase (glutamine-hydrolysing)